MGETDETKTDMDGVILPGTPPSDDLELDASRVGPFLEAALAEDVGPGDVTTNGCVPEEATLHGALVLREDGVVCGVPLVAAVFAQLDARCHVEVSVVDGARIDAGTTVARVRGPARALLTGERVGLNLLGRLSGIATLTRRFVDAIEGTDAAIYDTRKTTPGLRYLERYAVRKGGGMNHRFGLFDQVMIKDNHRRILRDAGVTLEEAIAAARDRAPPDTPIEVEADTVEEALAATAAGADIILLDNFAAPALAEAVTTLSKAAIKGGRKPPIFEASGGVNLDTVRGLAESGVARISIGALTHSARSLDVGLDL